jgi:hypothetical protein
MQATEYCTVGYIRAGSPSGHRESRALHFTSSIDRLKTAVAIPGTVSYDAPPHESDSLLLVPSMLHSRQKVSRPDQASHSAL